MFYGSFVKNKEFRQDGSVLIVVLWAIMLLSLFVVSFAFDAHMEAKITSYYRKRMKAEHLARSGVVLSEMVLLQTSLMDKSADKEDLVGLNREARHLVDAQSVTLTRTLGDGDITINIVTEMARRNVNLLKTEEEWARVLEVGDIPEEMWQELIDSVLDWVDPDNDPLMYGGETEDYYTMLDPPYRAKNGDLDTVDELLLVKGFNRAVLYGGVIESEYGEEYHMSGIADLLTTFGGKKVNVNAALPRVLLTLPSVGDDIDLIVGAICEELADYSEDVNDESFSWHFFESDADMLARIPELGVKPLRDYVTTQSEQFYRITSIGSVQGVERVVNCTVSFDKKQMVIMRWSEEG